MSPPPPPPVTGGAQPGPNYISSLVAQDRATIRRADFERVAADFNCEWEALAAVAEVESGRLGGFAADGRPIILYERHLFSRKTNSQFDASNPRVSNRSAGGYPPTQAERWAQLTEAYGLAPDAALESVSYGRFQVLGQNYRNGGYANVHDFVWDMAKSEQGQLKSFVDFIRANGLIDELQSLNWAGFARRYNGPSYEQYQYDTKMAAAYSKMKATPIA